MHHRISIAVAGLGVVAIAACSDLVAPPTTALRAGSAQFTAAPKITICHAAGLAGTTKFVSITVSVNGASAHFRNNGTPKAGHELDFIATPERPCNAPPAAQLVVCKKSSAVDPTTANGDVTFPFTTSAGGSFSLKFTQCSEPAAVFPGDVTITETHDPGETDPFGYFPTKFTVDNGSTVSSSGFSPGGRPSIAEDGIVTVTTTSGQLTTVTFYNQN